MLKPQVTVQQGSKEYKEYLRYLEKKDEDHKMIQAYLADPRVETVARAFASRNHVPTQKEAVNSLAVYKTPYKIYRKISFFVYIALWVALVVLIGYYFSLSQSECDAFSVWAALYLYVAATYSTLLFFMSKRFRAASFCVTTLTKHFLGLVDLNDNASH